MGRAFATHLLRNFVKKDASFFHPPAFHFWLGQSVGCIRPNKKLEKDKHVRARRRIGQKTARFFSLTSCALLAWEEPALYKLQRKVWERKTRACAAKNSAQERVIFSLTCCALLAWEEPALYKVQRKV